MIIYVYVMINLLGMRHLFYRFQNVQDVKTVDCNTPFLKMDKFHTVQSSLKGSDMIKFKTIETRKQSDLWNINKRIEGTRRHWD